MGGKQQHFVNFFVTITRNYESDISQTFRFLSFFNTVWFSNSQENPENLLIIEGGIDDGSGVALHNGEGSSADRGAVEEVLVAVVVKSEDVVGGDSE